MDTLFLWICIFVFPHLYVYTETKGNPYQNN
jgi:hypothetical protein